ncbi:Foramidopyrimidine DNA glycosylase [Mycoplasmopsis agalactiae 14628]|uniref:Foramidopyrimidine DNA glycosylase n=1 Tax=Mycoplasmopsis agalactiae 14628 TaxID=1110504 RepID=I5D608_MYCAA|nr:bifunctional DNA-formamidopyrimidine glycosylase/DNA-(apurinic or apyrimidinic site) lyase [Mycoplasmopsis agalactiae]EIN15117.1 Foramidopyrimidine DNA glycosylase [Mycoplasmopsis agalactiae 14628]
MPELPEVKTVVKALKSNVLNSTITNVIVKLDKLIKNATPSEFKNYLLNEKILDVHNVGKNIIYKLTNNKNLISHLRMTGKYFTGSNINNTRKHDYIIFELNNQIFLFYNDSRQFGTFHIKDDNELFSTKPLNKLGIEVDSIDPKNLYDLVRNKSIPIKSFLLDQSYILGIGNIYANEILFLSKISPWTKTNKIPYEKFVEILSNTKIILDKATELGGSTIVDFSGLNGAEGQFQNYLQVHMRTNLPCNKCSALIQQEFIAQRMTYYCPVCQKENYEQEK